MRQKQRFFSLFLLSPSSRRAWIEMLQRHSPRHWRLVALLAEGVDRNYLARMEAAKVNVALLAEGVDRNNLDEVYNNQIDRSPSSRRAWIEITCSISATTGTVSRPPRGGRG